jgi:hypothetical protein
VAERSSASLQRILEHVRIERDRQLRHVDALDGKAGIILGFSGVLVALAPDAGVLVDVARYIAVGGGVAALMAFWPRPYPVLDLRELRTRYLPAEEEFTQMRVLDTQILMAEQVLASTQLKAGLLKISMAMLALAVLLGAAGVHLD